MLVRSLLDCQCARYPTVGEYIKCSKGHKLGDGRVHIRKLERGDKLVCKTCQLCKDFVDMNNHKGEPCVFNDRIFCQEGYCSECNLNPKLTTG